MKDPTKLDIGGTFSMGNLSSIFATITEHWVVKGIVGLVLGINDWFFHPSHDLVTVVFVLLLLDTFTGVLKAFRNNNISSSGFFRFSLKMTLYLVMLCTGAALDRISPITGIISGLGIVATFLSLTEALSILENVASLGFAVPNKLISLLKFTQAVSGSKPHEEVSDPQAVGGKTK